MGHIAKASSYVPMDTDDRKAYYLNKRERFNELKVNGSDKEQIELSQFVDEMHRKGARIIVSNNLYITGACA